MAKSFLPAVHGPWGALGKSDRAAVLGKLSPEQQRKLVTTAGMSPGEVVRSMMLMYGDMTDQTAEMRAAIGGMR